MKQYENTNKWKQNETTHEQLTKTKKHNKNNKHNKTTTQQQTTHN